ncbi:unnamed protein product [Ambrosiozyma monospora]|uniref:Unnamed protein product n=1 Tax=Ambrosiozyma monospora TaxID=43982 RepID=A0A9W7DGY5_AMBMO|nr:unnamed protein product [Ambrosiozyma monospora]
MIKHQQQQQIQVAQAQAQAQLGAGYINNSVSPLLCQNTLSSQPQHLHESSCNLANTIEASDISASQTLSSTRASMTSDSSITSGASDFSVSDASSPVSSSINSPDLTSTINNVNANSNSNCKGIKVNTDFTNTIPGLASAGYGFNSGNITPSFASFLGNCGPNTATALGFFSNPSDFPNY